jgi:hypothetical protein
MDVMDDNKTTQDAPGYEPPEVDDHGDLLELTAAIATTGTEDGAAKQSPLHHNLSLPSLP